MDVRQRRFVFLPDARRRGSRADRVLDADQPGLVPGQGLAYIVRHVIILILNPHSTQRPNSHPLTLIYVLAQADCMYDQAPAKIAEGASVYMYTGTP